MKKKFLLFCLLSLFLAMGASALTKGDVNDDGVINIVDAMIVAQVYATTQRLVDPAVGDVSGDGVSNIVDALLIAQYYVGVIDVFPIDKLTLEVEVLSSALERDIAPQVSADEYSAVVNGINQFAYDFYGRIKGGDDNIFFSPVSLSFAFAMASAGAKGETRSEILETMHLPGDINYHGAFNKLENQISTAAANPNDYMGDDLIVRIANSTWGQKNYHFMADFLDTLAVNYGAAMNLLDFMTAPEPARLTINKWVSDQTEEMIKDLIPNGAITPDTRLVLTNAIYFFGNWKNQFDVKNTKNENFYNLDESVSSVPMMKMNEKTQYYDGPNYEMLIKTYQGTKRNAMYIFMADKGELEMLEAAINEDFVASAKMNARSYIVDLSMPKFDYSWKKSVVKDLKALGMMSAFSPSAADFSGINGMRNLFISDVFHEAAISVDEKGTEASAATAIIWAETSIPDYATMNINRPFIYLIRNEDTGAILFMGKVIKL
ncbi:MAG: hypothetical protein JXR70_03995 [Spirochaetales bacterium]|nr:hypothetical protein [Spirochaetales bacterium]